MSCDFIAMSCDFTAMSCDFTAMSCDYFNVCCLDTGCCLIMEYCPHGDLHTLLKNCKKKELQFVHKGTSSSSSVSYVNLSDTKHLMSTSSAVSPNPPPPHIAGILNAGTNMHLVVRARRLLKYVPIYLEPNIICRTYDQSALPLCLTIVDLIPQINVFACSFSSL